MLSSVPLQAGGDAMLISMLIGTLIGLVIAIGAGYWIYKDASKRENNELLWGAALRSCCSCSFRSVSSP